MCGILNITAQCHNPEYHDMNVVIAGRSSVLGEPTQHILIQW